MLLCRPTQAGIAQQKHLMCLQSLLYACEAIMQDVLLVVECNSLQKPIFASSHPLLSKSGSQNLRKQISHKLYSLKAGPGNGVKDLQVNHGAPCQL